MKQMTKDELMDVMRRWTAADLEEAAASAVVSVGKPGEGGRGFVVEINRQRLIITAAHCLPFLPPADAFSYTEDRTYPKILGPLGAEPTVWAECLFVDPVGDIAVLGAPNTDKASYKALVADVTPLAIGDAPKQSRERLQLPPDENGKLIPDDYPIWVDTPGHGSARLLVLDGKWIECSVRREGHWLHIDQEGFVVGGMSGSPIVSMDGRAIGVLASDGSGGQGRVLKECLPVRFLHGRRRR
jgi:hypothetical protein